MNLSTVLLVLFITLKLLGVIHWGWLWVLSPLWVSWGMFLLMAVVILMMGGKVTWKK